jgi:polysaccharide biosynthesis protein PslH
VNVLIVTIGPPHPDLGGGLNRTYQLLRGLTEAGDRVTLICVLRADQETYLDQSRAICDRVETVSYFGASPWKPFIQIKGERLNRWVTLLTQPRYRYAQTFAPNLVRCAHELLEHQSFDCLVVEHTAPAFVLRSSVHACRVPAIAHLHNIESILYERSMRLEKTGSGVWSLAKRTESTWKVRSAERAITLSYDRCMVTSRHDAAALDQVAHRSVHALVVPNGVDTEYFRPSFSGSIDVNTLVFTGMMSHAPNVDAVLFFVREVMPVVLRDRPDARFLVVGADPPADIKALDEGEMGHVCVVGAVPDVRPYLAMGRVAVVPLRSGSGTRLKILEAMAMEVPIVSTTIGAEGLEVIPGRHLLLADEPEDFASAVTRLMYDQQLARSLATEGRKLVEKKYEWDAIGASWREDLQEVVADVSKFGRRYAASKIIRRA